MQKTAGTGPVRLVAVVVTHDRLDQLKTTLSRLLAAPETDLAGVVVVDNASADGTAGWLAARDEPRLIVHRCATNMGGAGGFAAGMRIAVERAFADVVVVMDDDARPMPGAFAAFHATPRDPDRAYAAAVYHPDGRICEMNRPGLNPFARPRVLLRALAGALRGRARAAWHVGDAAFAAAPRSIDMGSFVGLFVPAEAVRRCGYPDPGLFLYGDDVIYSLGLGAAGIGITFDPGLAFEHDCETYGAAPAPAAAGRRRPAPSRVAPLWKAYYLQRNRLIMYRRAAGPLFWLFGPALALRWGRDARLYGAEAPAYRRVWSRAVRDGLARRTGLDHAAVRALASRSGSSGGSGPSGSAP